MDRGKGKKRNKCALLRAKTEGLVGHGGRDGICDPGLKQFSAYASKPCMVLGTGSSKLLLGVGGGTGPMVI